MSSNLAAPIKKMNFADIILPLNLGKPFTYAIPDDLAPKLSLGMRCLVPVGNKKYIGCVFKIHTTSPEFKTKPILEILDDTPFLKPSQLDLIQWAAAYYLTPLGEVFRHFIPSDLLKTKKNRTLKPKTASSTFEQSQTLNLTPLQKNVLEDIWKTTQPVLIHGITGSGKTEIYRQLAQEFLARGEQVLILVPEIGLTPQTIGRFDTLSDKTCLYHSGLTPAQRCQIWKRVHEGEASLVVATRSGIFLPFPNLKLIVIDEEHDSSYKQEERFCYHARDLALWRGEQEKIKIVLGSATPSLEMIQRSRAQKITRLSLNERATGMTLPKLEVIDLRNHSLKGNTLFSPPLLTALENNLKKKEQSLIFFNRRGFAPFVICRSCGDVPMCEKCDITLTLHKNKGHGTLQCHYCDETRDYVIVCEKCKKDTKTFTGFGTERVEEELQKLFPSARLARLDRDSAKGDGWLKTLEKMKRGEIDILIGTQMVTKGHDYPKLTLVGILDADAALHLPDFRASERTFQMITQVSGRAGRHQDPGHVLIQSYFPDHPSLEAAVAHDTEGFYTRELKEREEAEYPPFCRMIEIRLSAKKQSDASHLIRVLSDQLSRSLQPQHASLLGPSPSLIEKVREYYRWRLLIKTKSYLKIQPTLKRILDDFSEKHLKSSAKILINVDPVDMI